MRAQSVIVSDQNRLAAEFLKLSAKPTGDNGGTCFGDSGGPNFASGTNVILGVNSFGTNGNCAGVTYSYRRGHRVGAGVPRSLGGPVRLVV